MDLFPNSDIPSNFSKIREKGYKRFINPGGNTLFAVFLALFIEILEIRHVRRSSSHFFISKVLKLSKNNTELNKLAENLLQANTRQEVLKGIETERVISELNNVAMNYLNKSSLELKDFFCLSKDLNLIIIIFTDFNDEISIENFQYTCPATITIELLNNNNNRQPLICLKENKEHCCVKPIKPEITEEKFYLVNEKIIKDFYKRINILKLKEVLNQIPGEYRSKYLKLISNLSSPLEPNFNSNNVPFFGNDKSLDRGYLEKPNPPVDNLIDGSSALKPENALNSLNYMSLPSSSSFLSRSSNLESSSYISKSLYESVQPNTSKLVEPPFIPFIKDLDILSPAYKRSSVNSIAQQNEVFKNKKNTPDEILKQIKYYIYINQPELIPEESIISLSNIF